MADSLVAFLQARYDEDDQAARDAGGKSWEWEQHYGDMCNDPTCEYGNLATDDTILMSVHAYDIKVPWQGAEHIARHDPARVLAEVEAKRRLLKQFRLRGDSVRAVVQPSTGGVWDDMLRLLALPYADHPDYREEWRP
jgi:hypothetical protein